MDLADLKFVANVPAPIKVIDKRHVDALRIVKNAEIVDDIGPEDICIQCKVAGSAETPMGTCSVCGAAWSLDPRDDFAIALDLLGSCQAHFDALLKSKKVVNKMGWKDEQELRNLAMAVADFLDTYDDDGAETIIMP